jgi:hypothetical protein
MKDYGPNGTGRGASSDFGRLHFSSSPLAAPFAYAYEGRGAKVTAFFAINVGFRWPLLLRRGASAGCPMSSTTTSTDGLKGSNFARGSTIARHPNRRHQHAEWRGNRVNSLALAGASSSYDGDAVSTVPGPLFSGERMAAPPASDALSTALPSQGRRTGSEQQTARLRWRNQQHLGS